mgnify:FL=1
MNERYLGLKEVARILGVTPLTLRNWDRKGILTAYRNPANNYRMYRYADVADFVAEIKRSRAQPGAGQKLPIQVEDDAV